MKCSFLELVQPALEISEKNFLPCASTELSASHMFDVSRRAV